MQEASMNKVMMRKRKLLLSSEERRRSFLMSMNFLEALITTLSFSRLLLISLKRTGNGTQKCLTQNT